MTRAPAFAVGLVVAGGESDEALDHEKFAGRVGVAARVHERINLPGDTVQITLQGLRRITIESIDRIEPYVMATVKPAKETPADPAELDDLQRDARTVAEAVADAEADPTDDPYAPVDDEPLKEPS